MEIIRRVVDGYYDIMENHSDPRVNDWFLMSSPFPTLAICLTYVFTVKVLGPKLMENRKPFDLTKVLIFYNLFQVIFSIYLFYESIVSGWFSTYSFRCQPVDYSRSPSAMRTARGCWWYYFSKFTEFFDTIFFVMRKKYDHVSKLHVIHHGIMPMSVWFGVKFTPALFLCYVASGQESGSASRFVMSKLWALHSRNQSYHLLIVGALVMPLLQKCKGGHSTFFGMLNTFVHIVMYSYYLLAAMGPQIQKYLWWKKYITALQMVQFVLVFIHAFQLLFIDCNYPRAFVWWIGMHAVLFYYLFSDFYKQAYLNKNKAMHAAITILVILYSMPIGKNVFLIRQEKSAMKAKVDDAQPSKTENIESKNMLLNGFRNGSTLGDVRQRMAGAVASQ